jgi:hypothetical protein
MFKKSHFFHNVSLLLPVIITFSCNEPREPKSEDSESVKINLSEALIHKKNFRLSDIADSIIYVPLEPVKDRPVKEIYYFAFFRNDIFINAGSKSGVLHYDGRGNFINTVASPGNRKGQYLPGSDFSINSNSRRIYVLTKFSPRKIMVYDYSGYLFNEFRVTVSAYGGFDAISDNRFLFLAGTSNLGTGIEEYMACVKDRDDHTLTKISHPLPASGEINLNRSIDYQGVVSGKYFEGAPIFYDGNAMDTIYSVKNDSIYARYVIIKEGSIGSGNATAQTVVNGKSKSISIIPTSFTETPRHVFITFIFSDSCYVSAYDKVSQSVSSMRSDMYHIGEFENDIDGGLSVHTGKTNRQGDVWLYIFPAKFLKNRIATNPGRKGVSQPEKQKALIKFAGSLSETDDPVIMAVYLKKALPGTMVTGTEE